MRSSDCVTYACQPQATLKINPKKKNKTKNSPTSQLLPQQTPKTITELANSVSLAVKES
jgi:hypothetical protein